MQMFHFIAAWLFPGAVVVSKVAKAATIAESFDPDNASPLAFSVKVDDDSGSSISSSPSSSPSDGHPRFFTSRQEHCSPPASPLCFGAGGGGGVGRLLLLRGSRGARARSPTKRDEEGAAAGVVPAAKQHGDVVGRYLRKISKRLRKASWRAPDKVSPSSPGRAADDTARERAEAVARAIAYCKEKLRRGATPQRPPPLPSLDDLLNHDRQEEIIASAAAYFDRTPGPRQDGSLLALHRRGIECRVSPPPPPRPHRAGELAQLMQVMGKQVKESTLSALSSRESSITASDVVHGDDYSPPHGHDDAMDECRRRVPATMAEAAIMSSSPSDVAADDELEMRGSFDEMEFLNIFDGDDDEMIDRHFITIGFGSEHSAGSGDDKDN